MSANLNITIDYAIQQLELFQNAVTTFDLEYWIQTHIRVIIMCIPFVVLCLFIVIFSFHDEFDRLQKQNNEFKKQIIELQNEIKQINKFKKQIIELQNDIKQIKKEQCNFANKQEHKNISSNIYAKIKKSKKLLDRLICSSNEIHEDNHTMYKNIEQLFNDLENVELNITELHNKVSSLHNTVCKLITENDKINNIEVINLTADDD